MAPTDSLGKGKQVVFSPSDEEGNDEEEDEEEEDDDDDSDSDFDDGSDLEEEGLESDEEGYNVEESESDQVGDGEDDGYSDEDDEYEDISEDQITEDEDETDGDRKESKPSDEELSDRVVGLLQRNQKLDTLKLEECKAYLRKHKLMISGTKATCIQRILEHWRLKDGNGERLYPKCSFIINCTGDVCKGDVVMFKQRVYEKFDNASKRGKLVGKRTAAGRVVKESYGGGKQQHTFTIEVLWSTGVKALLPMHTLLVKGRNLYRYKTFRLPWRDEAERSKVLDEKHERGALARSLRASANKCRGSKRKKSSVSKKSQKKRLRKHSKTTCQQTSVSKTQSNTLSNRKHAASEKNGKKQPAADHNKSKAKKSAGSHLKKHSKTTSKRSVQQTSLTKTQSNTLSNRKHAASKKNGKKRPAAGHEKSEAMPSDHNLHKSNNFVAHQEHWGMMHHFPVYDHMMNQGQQFDSRNSSSYFTYPYSTSSQSGYNHMANQGQQFDPRNNSSYFAYPYSTSSQSGMHSGFPFNLRKLPPP